jgi:dTDP-D-glucose 4,6-dehydratase
MLAGFVTRSLLSTNIEKSMNASILMRNLTFAESMDVKKDFDKEENYLFIEEDIKAIKSRSILASRCWKTRKGLRRLY